jgi:hypothetical protein
MKSYRISDPQLRERLEYHGADGALQSIRQEIVLLRAMVEERLSFAKTEAEKILAFQSVIPALSGLTKMSETVVKLETQSSELLERGSLEKLSILFVKIVSDELTDDEAIARVANRVSEEFNNLKNN